MRFTGPPFTVASYIIEARPSKNYNFTKPIIYRHHQTSFPLINHLLHISIHYVLPQLQPPPQIIHIFHSCLPPLNVNHYPYYINPPMNKFISRIKPYYHVPIILFRVPPTHLINQSNHLPIDLLPL
ncbi:uroporphyrinogen decarboxylase family protein, partial [Staphylococcus epidermidis]|uniref:uroporphyrinogen decarboxylase family protein n=1 Tax=Staphylococcus epidermidis TaxID=1282 RepID=UPI0028CB7A1A